MSSVPQTYPVPLTPEQLNYSDSAQWRQLARQLSADIRVATPAFLVEDMDAATQTVAVQVALQERVRPPQGPAQWWDLAPVFMVPVVLPSGGGFSLTMPLRKGDEGLLVFCDTCFDNWWRNGQTNAPKADNVDAPSGSQQQFVVCRHEYWDCGFVPGMRSQPSVLSGYSTSSAQLRTDDGAVYADVAAGGVTLRGPAVTASNGGAAQALVTDGFYQWYLTNVLPFLQGLGYTGPTPPANSETTILKGQ